MPLGGYENRLGQGRGKLGFAVIMEYLSLNYACNVLHYITYVLHYMHMYCIEQRYISKFVSKTAKLVGRETLGGR